MFGPLATRSVGVSDRLAEVLPPVVRDAFAVLTHAGSVPVLVVLLALAYWFGDRRRGATALEILFGGFATFLALKRLFALPRPPSSMRAIAETSDGLPAIEVASLHGVAETSYGFPSAHTLDAVVGFGLLAMLVERGTPLQRTALATLGVLLVGFSRLAIGVHYLVDVLAGAAIGLAYLVAAVRLADWDPTRGLAIAVVLSVIAIAVGDARGALTLLGAVGVFVGHRLLESRDGTPAPPDDR